MNAADAVAATRWLRIHVTLRRRRHGYTLLPLFSPPIRYAFAAATMPPPVAAATAAETPTFTRWFVGVRHTRRRTG